MPAPSAVAARPPSRMSVSGGAQEGAFGMAWLKTSRHIQTSLMADRSDAVQGSADLAPVHRTADGSWEAEEGCNYGDTCTVH